MTLEIRRKEDGRVIRTFDPVREYLDQYQSSSAYIRRRMSWQALALVPVGAIAIIFLIQFLCTERTRVIPEHNNGMFLVPKQIVFYFPGQPPHWKIMGIHEGPTDNDGEFHGRVKSYFTKSKLIYGTSYRKHGKPILVDHPTKKRMKILKSDGYFRRMAGLTNR